MGKKHNEKRLSNLTAGKALLEVIAQEQKNPPLKSLSTDVLFDLATKICNKTVGISGARFAALTNEDCDAIKVWLSQAMNDKKHNPKKCEAYAIGRALLEAIAKEQNPPQHNPSTDYLYDLATNIGNNTADISGTRFAELTQENRDAIEVWRRQKESGKNASKVRADGKALLEAIAKKQNPLCHFPSTDDLYDLATKIGNKTAGIIGARFKELNEKDRYAIEVWRRNVGSDKNFSKNYAAGKSCLQQLAQQLKQDTSPDNLFKLGEKIISNPQNSDYNQLSAGDLLAIKVWVRCRIVQGLQPITDEVHHEPQAAADLSLFDQFCDLGDLDGLD